MEALVVSLERAETPGPAGVGAKASAVARMRGAGLPVPGGFVVTTAAFEAVAATLRAEIAAALGEAGEDPARLEAVEQRVRALFAEAPLPEGLADAIEAARRELGDGPLAVRSSATAEDLEGASFAGQYDSYLGVRGLDGLTARVRDVWASLFSARALAYRAKRGIDAGSMAVLVQAMAPAETSGVMFTRDPMTGAEDRLRIEATWGLGEGLVGGETAADEFVLDAGTLEVVERRIAEKAEQVVLDPAAGTRRAAVAEERRDAPALDDEALAALGRLALRVRELFGGHRDIEFAAGGGEVWLLQARPITALEEAEPFEFEWPSAEHEGRSWRLTGREPAYRLQQEIDLRFFNKHAAHCFELCGSPLVQEHISMYLHGWRYNAAPEIDAEALRKRQRRWQERVGYWLDRGTTRYLAEIEPELLEVHAELKRERPRRAAPLSEHLEYALLAADRAAYTMGDLHWRMVGLPGGGEPDLPSVWAAVTGRPAGESAVLLQGIDNMTTRLVRRLRGMAGVVQSDRELAAAMRARDFAALAREPLRGRPAVRTLRSRLRSLLRVYGHHTGHGFGSSTDHLEATWNMEPERVLEIVARYAEADLDELERLERKARRERLRETARARRLAARDPALRARFERALFAAQAGVRMMEDHNHLIEQGTAGIVREAVRALGEALVRAGRLDEPDDVYHLGFDEVETIAHGGALDARSLVRERGAERRRSERMRPPRTLGVAGVPPDFSSIQVEGVRDVYATPESAGLDGRVLRGVGASRARGTGRARVVLDGRGRLPEVGRGEVLVAKNAGPDWTPVFPLLGGLVLDQGAAFQHAALVAREYGIPAVVMTREGTRAIRDGQMVTVDGVAGTVELGPEPR